MGDTGHFKRLRPIIAGHRNELPIQIPIQLPIHARSRHRRSNGWKKKSVRNDS